MRVTRGSDVTLVVVVGPAGRPDADAGGTVVSARTGVDLDVVVTKVDSGVSVAVSGADIADLDALTVTVWVDVDGERSTQSVVVDVVDRHVVTVGEIVALPDMGAADRDAVARIRDDLTDHAEQFVGRAFVGRLSILTAPVTAGVPLVLSEPVAGLARVVQGDSTVDAVLVDSWSVSGGWSSGWVTVVAEVAPVVCPGDLARTLLATIRREWLARGAKAPVDTLSETFDGRTVRLAQPGRDKPTGTLALDTLLTEMREASSIPGFA